MERIEETKAQGQHKEYFSFMYHLYKHGFKTMSRTSKILWIIVLVKLFIMFAILKPLFFPRVIESQGDKKAQTEYVVEQITRR